MDHLCADCQKPLGDPRSTRCNTCANQRRRKAVTRDQLRRQVWASGRGAGRLDQLRPRTIKETAADDDRVYTPDEIEFLQAIDQYKRLHRRPFPAWSEVLAVFKSLGYRKVAAPAEPPAVAVPALAALERGVCNQCGESVARQDLPKR